MTTQTQGLDLQLGFELRDAIKQLGDFQKQTAKALKGIEDTSKKSFGDFQKQAKDSLKGVEDQAKRTADGMGRAFTAFKAVAVGAIAVLGAKEIADFFKAGVEGALADEAALKRLQTAMEQTGEFSKRALDGMSGFADQIERTTKFSGDAVLNQLALAKSFGASNEGAKNLVRAAADLSAATGKDLETSVTLLGKTLGGTTGKLKDQIPALKLLTEEQLKSGKAIEYVLARFGGAAAKDIDTFSGAVQQAGNAFDDLRKTFGKIIIENPAVVGLVKGFTDSFRELGKIVDARKDGLKKIVTEFAIGFAEQIPAVLSGVDALSKAFGILTGGGEKNAIASFFEKVALSIGFVTDETLTLLLTIEKLKKAVEENAPKGSVLGGPGGFGSMGITTGQQGPAGSRIPDDVLVPSGSKAAAEESVKRLGEIEASIKALTELREQNLKRIADATGSGGSGPRAPSGNGLLDQLIDASLARLAKSRQDAASDPAADSGSGGAGANDIPDPGRVRGNAALFGPPEHLRPRAFDRDDSSLAFDPRNAGLTLENFFNDFKEGASAAGASFWANMSSGEFGARKFVSEVLKGPMETLGDGISFIGKEVGDLIGGPMGAAVAGVFGAGGAFVGAIGGALEFLGQDPETFATLIDGFVKGIPKIIDNIVANIPTLVIAIAENAGPIITSLAAAMPRVAIALAGAMPEVAAALLSELGAGIGYQAEKFGSAVSKAGEDITAAGERLDAWFDSIGGKWQASWDGFSRNAEALFGRVFGGVEDFGESLGTDFRNSVADAAADFADGLFGPLSDFVEWLTPGDEDASVKEAGVGAVTLGIGRPKLAKGGTIPPGFPNDSFNANLESGEMVVPRKDLQELQKFLEKQKAQALFDAEKGNPVDVKLADELLSFVNSFTENPNAFKFRKGFNAIVGASGNAGATNTFLNALKGAEPQSSGRSSSSSYGSRPPSSTTTPGGGGALSGRVSEQLDAALSILTDILAAIHESAVSISINEDGLAKAMLNLDRRNARVAR